MMGSKGLATIAVAGLALVLAGSACSTSPAAAPPVELSVPSTLDVVPPGRPAGTPDWRVTHPGPPHAIEGFADRTSALPGEATRRQHRHRQQRKGDIPVMITTRDTPSRSPKTFGRHCGPVVSAPRRPSSRSSRLARGSRSDTRRSPTPGSRTDISIANEAAATRRLPDVRRGADRRRGGRDSEGYRGRSCRIP